MVEERYIILTGTAGAGKSVLTGVLKEEIERHGFSAITVNLDPAVKVLPYEANVDVRDIVSYDEYLRQGLGPNGALIVAVDSLVLHADVIKSRIEEYKADYVILDTPGQMEVFVYRVGGPLLIRAITGGAPAVNVYLMDALFFEEPLSIASALNLASSVYLRLMLPQINTVSKADLLQPEVIEKIIPRLGEEGFLEGLIEAIPDVSEQAKYIALKTLEGLRSAGFIGEVYHVSTLQPETVATLFGGIQAILSGGETERG
ncbi:MAG: ATP/GTP-binding protein [Desulfurococcales archaeon]|nr:ATP/GTP-binding protein [Desulfurococcales archaeon]